MPPQENFVTFNSVVDFVQEHVNLDDREALTAYLRDIVRAYLAILDRTDENNIDYTVRRRPITQNVEMALHIGKTRLTIMLFEETTANRLPTQLVGTKITSDMAGQISLVKQQVFRLINVTHRPHEPFAVQRSQVNRMRGEVQGEIVLGD